MTGSGSGSKSQHIETEERLRDLKSKAEQVFYLDHFLWENPFRTLHKFSFLCWGNLVTADFGEVLKTISSHFNDQRIYVLVQDPPPETHWWPYRYGAIESYAEWNSSDYYEALTRENKEGDGSRMTINTAASTLFIFGDTGNWGFYYDRDWDLMVAAANGIFPTDICKFDWWMTKEDALDIVAHYNAKATGINAIRRDAILALIVKFG